MSVRVGAKRLERRIASFVRGRLDAARGQPGPPASMFGSGTSHASMLRTRETIADVFLRGDGIEIGALHQPLPVPPSARVKYVDRMPAPELRRQYQELEAEHAGRDRYHRRWGEAGDDRRRHAGLSHRQSLPRALSEPDPHDSESLSSPESGRRALSCGAGQALHLRPRPPSDDDRTPDARFSSRDQDGPRGNISKNGPDWSASARMMLKSLKKRTGSLQWTTAFISTSGAPPSCFELMVTLQRFVQFEVVLFLRNGFENILILSKPAERAPERK